jgi:hypothetical protein
MEEITTQHAFYHLNAYRRMASRLFINGTIDNDEVSFTGGILWTMPVEAKVSIQPEGKPERRLPLAGARFWFDATERTTDGVTCISRLRIEIPGAHSLMIDERFN